MNLRLFEFNLGGGRLESINQFSIQGGGENLAGVISGKGQIGSSLRVEPDGGVVQVEVSHFIRSVHQIYRLEVRADLENSSSWKREVRLLFAGPAVNGKAPV